MAKNFVIGFLGVLVLVLGGILLFARPPLGSETSNSQTFHAGISFGGVDTITAATTTTLTAKQVCENGLLNWSPLGPAATATLPTGPAIAGYCLHNLGDFKDLIIRNSSTTGFFGVNGSSSSSLLVQVGNVTSSAPNVNTGEYLRLRFIYRSNSSGQVVDVSGIVF